MKTVLTYLVLVYMLLTHSSLAQQPQIHQYSTTPALTLDSASILVETNKCIHAIAFDNKGEMFVGGCRDIYRITSNRVVEHFITLSDTSSKTCIWGMIFNSKGDLYIAAFDRIVKVTSSGEQTVVVQEDFSGPCGVTDLRFDQQGRLLAVYDDIVARYDSAMNKSILISGKNLTPPIQWGVGLELDEQESILYIADCNGKNLYLIPYQSDSMSAIKVFPTNMGQYLTKNSQGEIFLTMHGPPSYPEFLMFYNMELKYSIRSMKQPVQDGRSYKKTIAWNNFDDNKRILYCIVGSAIYAYNLSEASTK